MGKAGRLNLAEGIANHSGTRFANPHWIAVDDFIPEAQVEYCRNYQACRVVNRWTWEESCLKVREEDLPVAGCAE